ncbi:hypothetical protein HV819_07685 [Anaerococcus sp. AGMB00486]|uniref:Uncharacterized protein n=1 Tax=Anaerococcus faecalis TaxID=2742993 RepID=A0ABX2NAZ1_9FIRM|nr:hypothetical protein [Anaerococcus faecalis]NVF11858.1 hypothetical protein [Anaerococcus faecalis]
MERLFFITTVDELEWPIAVADSLDELADVYGMSVSSLYAKLRSQKAGNRPRGYKVEVVEVENEK